MENSENTGNFIPPFQTQQEPKHKAPVALIVAVIVLVLGLLGLGTAYYFQMSQANDLQRQVNDLNAAAEEMDREMAAMHEEPVAEYREIPELGVRYKLTDETKDLTYSYMSDENGLRKAIQISSIELSKIKDKSNEFSCTSSHGPAGIIGQYSEADLLKPEVKSAIDRDGKKIGDHYFTYEHPQYACDTTADGQPSVTLQKDINGAKAAFESLEAVPTS